MEAHFLSCDSCVFTDSFYKMRTKSQISNNNYTDYNYNYSELSLINYKS